MFDDITPAQKAAGSRASQPKKKTQAIGDPDLKSGSVYTMPKQFMPRGDDAAAKKDQPAWKRWLVISIVAGTVFIILVAIIVIVLQTAARRQQALLQEQVAAQQSQNTDTTETGDSEDVPQPVDTVTPQPGAGLSLVEEPIAPTLEADEEEATGSTGSGTALGTTSPGTGTGTSGSGTGLTTGTTPFPDRSDVVATRDKDRDNLTDEEENLYGTRFDLPDTDRDGFVDGTELLNLFSPTEAEETLINSGLTINYENDAFGWAIQYPSDWLAESLDASGREVVFTSDRIDGELVEVIVSDNPKGLTAAQWFASLYDDVNPADLDSVLIAGIKGIASPDRYTYYIADDEYIIAITYNFGTKEEIHFQTTFQMMVNSFQYTASTSASAAATATDNETANADGDGATTPDNAS